ncbi:N-acetyltransferase [Lysobacter helvus]|uniref:N-acetyltransferase n=2 Tax=Lysobacteraceae TaxID=32033 RepID=A0ABM7Q755_9GAMM|nr:MULTISPECIES: GNAT family N-acetyltransferase [Lysobacter]BCT93186.1 N-acetyltransferase [Lysobacter caseinilyticus]BCT96338.1 N-acetyltransferase [Lysobacter helvus]
MLIRKAERFDAGSMFAIVREATAAADTLPFRAMPDALCEAHWFGPHQAWVATSDDDRVEGIYKLGDNYPDSGSHVASATYIVASGARGRGIGRTLVEHSLDEARSRGYSAIVFNYVVASNAAAVALYLKLGFAVVGTIPGAFRHPALGPVDVYVMHRAL